MKRVKTVAYIACIATFAAMLSSCSSKAERERQQAIEKQKYYESEWRAKEKAILDAQGKGSSEAMKNWRFPDAPPLKRPADPKRSEQK
jgi:uncharacterized lipoprotein